MLKTKMFDDLHLNNIPKILSCSKHSFHTFSPNLFRNTNVFIICRIVGIFINKNSILISLIHKMKE